MALKQTLQQQLFNQLNQQTDGKLSSAREERSYSQAKAAQRKYDSRSIARYVSTLPQQSKEAYDVFREQALESGLYKLPKEPLPRIHRNYYDKYIRATHGTPLPSER